MDGTSAGGLGGEVWTRVKGGRAVGRSQNLPTLTGPRAAYARKLPPRCSTPSLHQTEHRNAGHLNASTAVDASAGEGLECAVGA
jgi:hypothetical protein